MKQILLIILGMVLLSCSSEAQELKIEDPNNKEDTNQSNESSIEDATKDNILIVYFSRTGENYPDNTILKVGRTATMSKYIQNYTKGAVFEIIPEINYPNSYEEMKTISQRETANNERPQIKDHLSNLEKYKVIFIGSPIWYGNPPMIMRTFYESYDLSDKIIIPFGTHEGSGIASCTSLLKSYFPNAKILESFGVRGQNIDDAQLDVEKWLQKIGVKKQ